MNSKLTFNAIRCYAQSKVCLTTSDCPSRKCKVTNKSTVPAKALLANSRSYVIYGVCIQVAEFDTQLFPSLK